MPIDHKTVKPVDPWAGALKRSAANPCQRPRPVANRRYGRLPVCVTSVAPIANRLYRGLAVRFTRLCQWPCEKTRRAPVCSCLVSANVIASVRFGAGPPTGITGQRLGSFVVGQL